MLRPALRPILLAAALAMLAVLSYVLRPADAPAVECDLNSGPCRAEIDGAELSLSLSPRPIPLLTPIRVEVRLVGTEAEAVRFELLGADMDMGPNRSSLVAEGGGRYTGNTTIPVCITGRMRWLAVVHVKARNKSSSLSFAFEMPGHAANAAIDRP